MGHFGAFCPIMGHNGATPFSECLILHSKMREQAAAQQFEHARLHSPCTVLASEIGNPTEILDTPKVISNSPRVFSNTPKVTTVIVKLKD